MPSDSSSGVESLRLAADAADLGTWDWDLLTDTQVWSDRCREHLALPPGEPASMHHMYAAMHPDDREAVRGMIRRAHQNGEDYHAEYRILAPDGSQRWIADWGRTYFDAGGRPVRMRGITLDITRLKQAEQNLRDLNASLEARIAERTAALATERRRLQATLDSMLDAHVLAVPVRDEAGVIFDFRILSINPAACAWIGRDHRELIDHRFLEIFPSLATTTTLMPMFAATVETGVPTSVDDYPFARDGLGTRWLDIRAVRVNGEVSFTWHDVTLQHEAGARLAASEERFRLLAENSSDVVVRTDREGRVLWVSPSIESALGWKPADWIGRTGAEVLGPGPEQETFVREHARAVAGDVVVVRTRLPAKSGDLHWAEFHAGPFRAADGTIDGVVASFRPVDKEVLAERVLEKRARTDDLTALLNRNAVLERITGLTRRTGSTVAVLLCDIDRFKTINDTKGHAAGDRVLQAVAERIRQSLRSSDDMAARIGGDELLVILHGVRSLTDAVTIADKLRKQAAEPIATTAGDVSVTLSIGVTLARPGEATDVLIARADDAMYAAKNGGRDQVVALEPPAAA